MKFGYHNHTAEFRKIGKTVGYDVLLQQTDPELVTFRDGLRMGLGRRI